MDLISIFNDLETKSDKRFEEFWIEDIWDLNKIQEDAYLETSTWLGWDEEFVCLAIDLDSSSRLSARKNVETMAKLYEYFTKNIVDVLNVNDFSADYIDIKWDWAFGIYQWDGSIERAFVAAVTFKTFFENVIKPKFFREYSINLCCKLAISKSKILVKKIWNRTYKNEVWAGRAVNNTYKIMSKQKIIKEKLIGEKPQNEKIINDYSLLILSKKIYDYLIASYKDYAILSCGCVDQKPSDKKTNLWREFETSEEDEVVDNMIYYNSSKWCESHWGEYLEKILDY